MAKKPKLKELIFKAQSGDKDALNQVIERFKSIVNMPAALAVKMYARKL